MCQVYLAHPKKSLARQTDGAACRAGFHTCLSARRLWKAALPYPITLARLHDLRTRNKRQATAVFLDEAASNEEAKAEVCLEGSWAWLRL